MELTEGVEGGVKGEDIIYEKTNKQTRKQLVDKMCSEENKAR